MGLAEVEPRWCSACLPPDSSSHRCWPGGVSKRHRPGCRRTGNEVNRLLNVSGADVGDPKDGRYEPAAAHSQTLRTPPSTVQGMSPFAIARNGMLATLWGGIEPSTRWDRGSEVVLEGGTRTIGPGVHTVCSQPGHFNLIMSIHLHYYCS